MKWFVFFENLFQYGASFALFLLFLIDQDAAMIVLCWLVLAIFGIAFIGECVLRPKWRKDYNIRHAAEIRERMRNARYERRF